MFVFDIKDEILDAFVSDCASNFVNLLIAIA